MWQGGERKCYKCHEDIGIRSGFYWETKAPRVCKKRCAVCHSASVITLESGHPSQGTVCPGKDLPPLLPSLLNAISTTTLLQERAAKLRRQAVWVWLPAAGKCLRVPAANTWRLSWKLDSGLGGRGVPITGGGQVQVQILPLVRRSQLGGW